MCMGSYFTSAPPHSTAVKPVRYPLPSKFSLYTARFFGYNKVSVYVQRRA